MSSPSQPASIESKVAAAGTVAGRMVGQQIRKRNWLRGLVQGAAAAGRSLLRVAHVLWLEVTGFFFLCFAVIGAGAWWREAHAHAPQGKIAVVAVFTLMFAWFGISSFWRARKRSRS